MNRVPLAQFVYPGENVTFSFNVTAPSTPGTYNFRWRMVSDTYGWFGAYTLNVAVKVGLNDAQFMSQTVPAVTVPGQTYPVSVTMKNTGGTTWSAGTNHRLGSQNPQNNTTWGTSTVALPSSVAPGETVAFSFNATAPGTAGTYNFQWRMVQDGVGWFGASSTNVAVKNGLNDAHFVSQSVPSVMQPGQSYAVSVTMQNTGGSTWSADTHYRLGSQNPQSNTTWGANRVLLSNPVAPGESVTFGFDATAPSTAGTYDFRWRMVRDGFEWFGEYSPNVAVKDGLDDAQLVSQSVPAIMTPGQSYAVSVTMQNTGSTIWSAGSVGLGSQNPQDNTTWGFNRVWLPSGVAPGATATFEFTVTAPSAPGTHNFQWRMVEGGLGWFGAATTNVAVQNGLDNAQFVSQSVPAAMVPGQIYSASVTMQNTGSSTWTAGAYRLGSQNPQNNSVWGLSRAELAGPVAPGANGTFTFDVTAPAASGPYNFQWRMLLGDADWFGAPSSNVLVNVGSTQANLFFIHADHLNAPRLIADSTGTAVWRWDQAEPFGVSPVDENPSGLGVFNFPLRFAGQYDDLETGLFYNYFRDYDPIVGRYVESDPIGLIGGVNTYLYANANPLRHSDRFGLDTAGCDGVPSVIEGPCTLRCCARHDECFDKWNCTGASWYKKDGCFPRQCDKCNKDARDCFTRCTYKRKHNADWEMYYCAKQHRYVRIPGDFPTQSAAEAACEHDHSKNRQCCTP